MECGHLTTYIVGKMGMYLPDRRLKYVSKHIYHTHRMSKEYVRTVGELKCHLIPSDMVSIRALIHTNIN